MIDRIKTIWKGHLAIKAWIKSGGMLVDYHVADFRVDTCKACPNNKSGNFWDWISRQLSRWISIPKRSKHQGVKTCQVCHCALRVKVQMPLTSILLHTKEDELKSFPDNCWIVKEVNE